MTSFVTPFQPLLRIPSDIHQSIWQCYFTQQANWTAYLNQVALQTAQSWLQAEYDSHAQPELDQQALHEFWQHTNGFALKLFARRVVIIPSKSLDREFCVPRAWIEDADLIGDCYIAAQVDPDDATVLLWGYVPCQQLKTKGVFNDRDQVYLLDAQELIQDFAVFGAMQRLGCL